VTGHGCNALFGMTDDSPANFTVVYTWPTSSQVHRGSNDETEARIGLRIMGLQNELRHLSGVMKNPARSLNSTGESQIRRWQTNKPFDVLAEGLISEKSRDDCPSFERLIAVTMDVALSSNAETIVATQVLRIPA